MGAKNTPWAMHVIDNSSEGADGVRLADANGDGLMDIVTGWEEGGVVMVYLNPGADKVKSKWPSVVAGRVKDVEDAVFVDLDRDGALDVVSCCEGSTKSMFVHWAPADSEKYLDSVAWSTEAIPASRSVMQWMFCLPLQVDGEAGLDLVAGGKKDNAAIGWFEAPADPRDLSQWKWHPISEAGWIMSLFAVDMDKDGDLDVLTSDRKGASRGVRWLEDPGPGPLQTGPWKNHFISARDRAVMFMTLSGPEHDSLSEILVSAKQKSLVYLRRDNVRSPVWENLDIALPEHTGEAKAVAVADINQDGKQDFVCTCEHAENRPGVFWVTPAEGLDGEGWEFHDISGPAGTKYDLVVCLDLDGDGDLDVITCEEKENLGVIWYENPLKNSRLLRVMPHR
ncbi:MAG: VCBS repeat-containing protein [Gemmatimonadota bacterium]|nr:VCBS repeat-containing protein [Gemmatimonadota bacterium]